MKCKKILTGIVIGALSLLATTPVFAGNLIYDTRGGTYIQPSATKHEPTAPKRTGFTFAGWLDENDAPVTFNDAAMTDDQVIHANWTPETYSIVLPTDITLTAAGDTATGTLSGTISATNLNEQARVNVKAEIGALKNKAMDDIVFGITRTVDLTEGNPLSRTNASITVNEPLSYSVPYKGTYESAITYLVDYQEPITVGFNVKIRDGSSLIGGSEAALAVRSITGANVVNPGDTVQMTITLNNGYTSPVVSVGSIAPAGTANTYTYTYTVPQNASGAVTVPLSVEAGTVNYTVKYRTENVDGTSYTVEDTKTLRARVNSKIRQSDYSGEFDVPTGFSLVEDTTVYDAGNGGTVINCDYRRNYYAVSVADGVGSENAALAGTYSDGHGNYKYGSTVSVSATLKSGYKNMQFYNGSEVMPSTNFTVPAGTVAITAKATPIEFHVTYNGNGNTGGTAPGAQDFIYGTAQTVADASTMVKDNFQFSHWNTDAGNNGTSINPGDDGSTLSAIDGSSVTLYAIWERQKVDYTANYYFQNTDNDQYTLVETKTLKAKPNSTVSLNTETDGNAAFKYATTPQGMGLNAIASTQNAVIGETDNTVTVNVYYDRNVYEVAASLSSASDGISNVTGSGSYRYGALVNITAVAKTGYHSPRIITVSNASASVGTASTSFYMPAADVIVTAKASPNTVSVTYNGNGNTSGTIPANQVFSYGTSGTIPGVGNLQKTGYTFLGWSESASATTATWTAGENSTALGLVNSTASKDTTLYAVWQPNQYTVTVNQGAHVASVTGAGNYDYNSSVTVGGTYDVGYHFSSVSGDKSTATFNMPANDVNVTVNAAPNKVTISYNTNGGTGTPSVSSTTATYDSAATLANVGTMEKEGFEFVGWATTASATEVEFDPGASSTTAFGFANTNATNTKTLYAVWEYEAITLTVGDTYSMGGYRWYCAEQLPNGSYAMQSKGMTHGAWPGYVDNGGYTTAEYSDRNIASFYGTDENSKLYKFYNIDNWKKACADNKGLYLVSYNKVSTESGKGGTSTNYYYRGHFDAAVNYSSFGATNVASWLGSPGAASHAYYVLSDSFIYDSNYQNNDFVLAPAFNLNPSKVTLEDHVISLK